MNNRSQQTGPKGLWLRKNSVPIWQTTSSAARPVWKLWQRHQSLALLYKFINVF